MDNQKRHIVNQLKKQMDENNSLIIRKSMENERLQKRLFSIYSTELPQETKDRYDKELASDNWRKYSSFSNTHQ